MNVTFTSTSPRNSPVVDSATGQHLFQLSTPGPFSFGWRGTTMRDAQNKEIGRYITGRGHSEVTFDGQTMRISKWLYEKSGSRGQTFTAQNGKSYEWIWENGGKGYKLIDCLTDQLVARGHLRQKNLFSPSKQMNIDVMPDGLPILDAIVLSFVLCQRLRRGPELIDPKAEAQRIQDPAGYNQAIYAATAINSMNMIASQSCAAAAASGPCC